MTVLILAADHDTSVDRVVVELDERGADVCRINTAWFPARLAVDVQLNGATWRGVLRLPSRTLDLSAVHSTWVRGPESYQFSGQLSAAETHHANLEAKYGLGGVLASLDVLWVNHPARSADAAYKPLQLAVAARSGLAVPETVITNDPAAVRRFCSAGRSITKLVGASAIYEEGVRKVGFTRLVTDADLADLRGIEVTTHLFQRWLPKSYEVRVVVIGVHLTAVAIHASSSESYVDWRTDYGSLTYDVIEPPADVAAKIWAVMGHFDLAYGALDFIVSPDGEWTFLEINPGGQYGWLEARTGASFTNQLADLLTKEAT